MMERRSSSRSSSWDAIVKGISGRVGDGFSGVRMSRARLNDLLGQAAKQGISEGLNTPAIQQRKAGLLGLASYVSKDLRLLILGLGFTLLFLAFLFALGTQF